MHDDRSFEEALRRRLRRYADTGVRPIDEVALRSALALAPRPSRMSGARSSAVAWAFLAFLIAAALVAALAAASPHRLSDSPARPLVFALRLGGLELAAMDGRDRVRIATDGRYGDPRWSADGQFIAVGHDPAGAAAPPLPNHQREQIAVPVPNGELLVLEPDGVLVAKVRGPLSAAVWSPSGAGEPRLAVVTPHGVDLIQPDGEPIRNWPQASLPGEITSIAWLPRQSDASAELVVSTASGVSVLDPDSGSTTEVAHAWTGSVISVAADSMGRRIATASQTCPSPCPVTIEVIDLADPAGVVVRTETALPVRPTFTFDSGAILIWPRTVPLDGGVPAKVTTDARVSLLDVGSSWTRTAGSRGTLFFHQYSGWNDRRWDVYFITTPDGLPRRLARDVMGADLVLP